MHALRASLFLAAAVVVLTAASPILLAAPQDSQPATTQPANEATPRPPEPAVQEAAGSRPSTQEAPTSRRADGGEGRERGEGRDRRPDRDRDGRADAEGDAPPGGDGRSGFGGPPAEKKPRKGIPVTDALVKNQCMNCHKETEPGSGLLGRISFMRKSPEGWEISLKRMIRHHELALLPDEARQIVRYLSNDHGLSRSEAERGLFEAERRVHVSDAPTDKDFVGACAACHSLGRVLSEQRDDTEWKYLKATHLAFFPLAQMHAFGGGGRGGGGNFELPPDFDGDFEALMERRRQEEQRQGGDRADRVLAKLAKDQPLFTPEWESWQVNRREVPLAGTWQVTAKEPGRGALYGTVEIKRTGEDAYESVWTLIDTQGKALKRVGKGLLYAGYSWRGRSELDGADPKDPQKTMKEVLLLSADWNEMKGRFFAGGYNELGMDVTLYRRYGRAQPFAVENGAMAVPSENNVLIVHGEGFDGSVAAADFFLGRNVAIKKVELLDAFRVRLVVDVAREAESGPRNLSFRAVPGRPGIVLYDTIDYVKVFPEQGFARIGGIGQPKQFERFEAVAMHRGKDDEPYTADDFIIKTVPVMWSVEEFPVRENDDDVKYVGTLDAVTGFFTPAVDGPNRERRWQANNVGDVYVVAKTTLTVRKIPKKKKPEPAESRPSSGPTSRPESGPNSSQPASQPTSQPASQPDSQPTSQPASHPASRPSTQPTTLPTTRPEPPEPIVYETKEFKSRGHLIVTVPLYVNWDRLEWKD